jgi:hypothetical protein
MKDRVSRVDDVLIDRLFQPLVDWMNCEMAIGAGRAARILLDLAALAWICAEAGSTSGAMAMRDVQAGFVVALILVAGLSALTILKGVFRHKDGGGKSRGAAQANPLRAGMQVHRVVCLVWVVALLVKTALVPADFAALALLAVGLFATAAVYIGACSNRPPKKRARLAGWTPATISAHS